jgi:hypothetical protein
MAAFPSEADRKAAQPTGSSWPAVAFQRLIFNVRFQSKFDDPRKRTVKMAGRKAEIDQSSPCGMLATKRMGTSIVH